MASGFSFGAMGWISFDWSDVELMSCTTFQDWGNFGLERGLDSAAVAVEPAYVRPRVAKRVCMHVLGVARTDVRVMREATALAQAGYAVAIVDVERDRTRPREEELSGVRIVHIRMPGWFVPTRFKPWFLVKAMRLFIERILTLAQVQADAYHAHDAEALLACYIVACLRHKPLILDAHELPLVDHEHTKLWRRRVLGSFSLGLLRRILPRCSGVITVSPPLVGELQRRYGGRAAVVVRNIPMYQAPIASNRLRDQLDLDSHTRIALYQGNLQPDRELGRLIRAARFVDAWIVMVLMGGGPVEPDLRALIVQEGVSERVKILPPVPYQELLEWTASADIGLIVYPQSYSPNVRMCLPNKLFEYLMAGLPVLASPLEAVAEIIRTYDVGDIVPSLEPETIGRSISALLADGEALNRLHHNALAATRRDLRWEVESQQLIRFYDEMLLTHATGSVERDRSPVR